MSPFPGARGAVAAYSQVEVETGVTTADPHKLILMLFDGALLCIASAKQHMTAGQAASKGENLSKAIDIITNGLKASLNPEVGGELTVRLAALYDYMAQRLLFANMKNSVAALDEIHGLLSEIKDAWEQIGDRLPEAA